jgi:hypothetical protein
MNFSDAFNFCRHGKKIFRSGWNGKGQYVMCQYPDEGSKNTVPYLYILTVSKDRVPWLPSQSDLFAIDWETD